jgi:hypothetical protein
MTRQWTAILTAVAMTGVAVASNVASSAAQKKPAPQVQVPNAGVPQIATIEGEYIRIAYNNEGYVSLGYRTANQSLGDPWIMVEVGATVRQGQPNYQLPRSAISLTTPDGATVPLPSNPEYQKVDLRAMEARSTVVHDRVDYFPPSASRPCRIGFFAENGSAGSAYEQVELSWQSACVGRLYFPVKGGIKHGQYFLNVKFPNSEIRVPFRIFTDDEKKLMSKNYKDIKKQVEAAFKKGSRP